jgi:hypothetical protein
LLNPWAAAKMCISNIKDTHYADKHRY